VHAPLARNWLAAWLDAEGPGKDEQIHGALVASSELVTNAVLHAAGPVTVHTRPAGRRLLCQVTDRSVELPRLLGDARGDECQRGLSLVERMTAFWWVHAAPGGG
jgi:anti-sigma regulatory factor (Ser/Thr protein kinase)